MNGQKKHIINILQNEDLDQGQAGNRILNQYTSIKKTCSQSFTC